MNDWFDELQKNLNTAFDRAVADFEAQCDAAFEEADRWLVQTIDDLEATAAELAEQVEPHVTPEMRQFFAEAEMLMAECDRAVDRSLDLLDEVLFDWVEDDTTDRIDRTDGPNSRDARPTYDDPSDDPNWFGPLSHVRPTDKQYAACQGCQHYHGYRYGENLLVCAMHPYGWDDEHCPDWESDRNA